jgi:hypothetical protein
MYYNDQTMTEMDWEYQDVMVLGSERPNNYWILSDRDCWYSNPCYIPTINALGTKEQPHEHPENERYEPVVEPVSVLSLLNANQNLDDKDIDIDDCPF